VTAKYLYSNMYRFAGDNVLSGKALSCRVVRYQGVGGLNIVHIYITLEYYDMV